MQDQELTDAIKGAVREVRKDAQATGGSQAFDRSLLAIVGLVAVVASVAIVVMVLRVS